MIRLYEMDAMARLHSYIDECSAEELAKLIGVAFGGKCTYMVPSDNGPAGDTEFYAFEPRGNYKGGLES